MSDNYEFEKSRIPQGVDYESPYVAKIGITYRI